MTARDRRRQRRRRARKMEAWRESHTIACAGCGRAFANPYNLNHPAWEHWHIACAKKRKAK